MTPLRITATTVVMSVRTWGRLMSPVFQPPVIFEILGVSILGDTHVLGVPQDRVCFSCLGPMRGQVETAGTLPRPVSALVAGMPLAAQLVPRSPSVDHFPEALRNRQDD